MIQSHVPTLYHYHEAYAMENKHMLRQWDHMDTAWIHHTSLRKLLQSQLKNPEQLEM